VEEQKEWKEFRQVLDKSDRKAFDNMFSIAQLYNSACSYAAKPIKIQPIFMSIIFHHYKQLMKIKEERNLWVRVFAMVFYSFQIMQK
jgi:hypothetical protein